MEKIIGVRFRSGSKLYYFSPNELPVNKGDDVIVETVRGVECGKCVTDIREMDEANIVQPLKPIIRIATPEDLNQVISLKEKEKKALQVFSERIGYHGLDMSPVNVEYTFDESKIVFYFTADGRVDFRELVKDMAGMFHTRIELCQIGVRDETKMMGGLGSCGRVCCCNAYLGEFQPVSIKMAKEQGLSLNPVNISGLCGRLMCCLKYEQSCYEEARKLLPKVGAEVVTPSGNGIVTEVMPLPEKVKVKVALEDGTFDMSIFHISEINTAAENQNKPNTNCKKCKKSPKPEK